jgi:Bacterial PH domain
MIQNISRSTPERTQHLEQKMSESEINYDEKSLPKGVAIMPGEKIHFVGKLSRIIFLWAGIWGSLGFFMLVGGAYKSSEASPGMSIFIGLGLMLTAMSYDRRKNTKFIVTDKRLIFTKFKTPLLGRLSKKVIDIPLEKVESSDFTQDHLASRFGYGNITVRGTGTLMEVFPRISQVQEVKNAITAALECQKHVDYTFDEIFTKLNKSNETHHVTKFILVSGFVVTFFMLFTMMLASPNTKQVQANQTTTTKQASSKTNRVGKLSPFEGYEHIAFGTPIDVAKTILKKNKQTIASENTTPSGNLILHLKNSYLGYKTKTTELSFDDGKFARFTVLLDQEGATELSQSFKTIFTKFSTENGKPTRDQDHHYVWSTGGTNGCSLSIFMSKTTIMCGSYVVDEAAAH